jgi:hypothetical protein
VGCLWATGVGSCGFLGGFLVFLEGWVGVLCSCRFSFSWVCLVGFFLSFFGLFFFSISSFAFSLVYCRCTKGRLTLLIKSVYYL